jgi:hypothetical protein
MKSHSHIGFWFMAFLLSIFLSPMLIPADTMYDRLTGEVDSINRTFGPRVGAKLVGVANEVHAVFSRTGADDAVRKGTHSEGERAKAEKYLSVVGKLGVDLANGYFSGLSMQFYAVILRALIVLLWVLLLAPFVAAVLVDGLSQRQAKLSEFGYQSPTAFAIGTHIVIAISALPLLYVSIPMSITPLFMPFWALATALPMALAISHMQPVFTR